MLKPSLPATKRLILLVDDEPLVRAGTALMLEELGHRVVQALTAVQGLVLLEENNAIEMLITDFRMPDMDGLQFIARAKEMRPAVTALLMTGYNADDPRFADVATPRLAKPFGFDALEAALLKAL